MEEYFFLYFVIVISKVKRRMKEMANENVKKAQIYLNNMYGHRSEWVRLKQDGVTGSKLCQGLIRAFQIENGVSPVTGNVGDLTLNAMRKLGVIKKMAPSDEPNANVCILQCALFAKGYNAGGITGIYYTTGVNAVRQYQTDANLTVTGNIDWKVWMGLISLNWFTKTSNGDGNIVTIQRQLNKDWSDIIGVGPCDGVVSRFTAYALIAALQAAEGIYSGFIGSLDGSNFGEKTTDNFPGILKLGQNGEYVKYNKLVQYGLYLNGYNPGRFDGIFDETTKQKVIEFQKFYALSNINLVTLGEVNCSTMKSLLTSKGDVKRSAKACDCATVLNRKQALDLKAAGYDIVGRYLTGHVGQEQTRKFLTFEEIDNIENAGLRTFLIYQDGGYRPEYFQDLRQGSTDAHVAIKAAKRIGAPEGSTIYFAVDFDCYAFQLSSYIVPYFKELKVVFRGPDNTKNYKVGIYAPRYVCTYISNLGLAEYSFVADMSSGFSCNLGYPIPKNWAFDQFFELNAKSGKFSSTPSFDLDKDGYSGRDTGISSFDTVPYLTPDELDSDSSVVMLKALRDQFVYNVLEPLGYLNWVTAQKFDFNEKLPIMSYLTNGFIINISATITEDINFKFADEPIEISLDASGKLTTACESKIDNLIVSVAGEFDGKNIITEKLADLKDVAISITNGNIGYSYDLLAVNPTFSFIVTTNDIFPESDVIDGTMGIKIDFEIVKTDDGAYSYEFVREIIDNIKATSVTMGVLALVLIPDGLTMIPALLESLGFIISNM